MLFECRHDFPTILVKKLVYVSPFLPATLTPETSKWLSSKYINYFTNIVYSSYKLEIEECDSFPLLLFLDRHQVRPGTRSIINYSEVKSWAEYKGFKILQGIETLAEIVFYFSKSKFIFGAHGSLFANTIFAPEDCQIVEFCSNKRIDKSFQKKHKVCKNYEWILCESDDYNNVFVDIKLLQSYLSSSLY